MPERLFIQLHADSSAVTWLRQGAIPDRTLPRTGPLSDLSGESANCRVIVFVPGSDVTLITADVPPMSQQRMLTAVPFALEDQLAGDIDSLHFVFGRRTGREPLPVAVLKHDRMKAWLSRLDKAGVRPDVLVSSVLGLPSTPDTWTILVDTEMALVRFGPLSGFAVDLPNLAIVVRDALIQAGEKVPHRIRLLSCSEDPENVPLLESVDCQVTVAPCEPNKLAVLSAHFDEQRAINLLQGAYSRRIGFGEIWRAWRMPVALATVWFAVWIGNLFVDIADLSARSRLLETEIASVYRQAFPDARKMNNPRTRMARGLDELRKAGTGDAIGFLDLLGQVGVHLQSAPNARLTNLHFRSGELELRVKMADLEAFDQLKERLIREAGLTVEVLSATTRESTVMGHLKISYPVISG
ncbi:MAG: type II secretion system protein GspL [Gammaproteobacteria bacterium]|nr:type II secretion system protein GspL [Gammaproteobacteria bacterium]NNJ83941.1 type II secretion system protein GspL [Gammaproteobacteria bacterium]